MRVCTTMADLTNGPKLKADADNLKLSFNSFGIFHSFITPSSDPVANNLPLKGEKSKSVTCPACPVIKGKPVNRPQASIGRIASDPIPKYQLLRIITVHMIIDKGWRGIGNGSMFLRQRVF